MVASQPRASYTCQAFANGAIMEVERTKVDDSLEYLTVGEFTQRVPRTTKTAYNWINKGLIGAEDGVVTIQGRILFIGELILRARSALSSNRRHSSITGRVAYGMGCYSVRTPFPLLSLWQRR